MAVRIGADLGGTNIKAGIVSEDGNILGRMQTPTMAERSSSEIIKSMAELIKKLLRENDTAVHEVMSIGIGMPGAIDTKKGTVEFANNFADFKDVSVIAGMQEYFSDIKISIENDANAAALGESVAGAAKGYKHSMMITLGTGVGAGIIIDGRIYGGSSNGAGEIGHMLIRSDGELCTCGRRGCFERYTSASALVRRAVIAARDHVDCIINELCDNNYDKIDGVVLFSAYNKKDKYAVKIVDDFIADMVNGLVNLIYLYDPEIIVIGGGLSAAVKGLLPEIIEKIIKVVEINKSLKTVIKIADLENAAGIIGAAFL